jgi:hypothetical protein
LVAYEGVMLYFPVSYSVDEFVGSLRLYEAHGLSDKGPVRQLFDGCRKLLQ